MELLKPTLNKIISYQFLLILLEGTNYEQSSQNNHSTWCNLHEGFFAKKKLFIGGKPFQAKNI